MISRDNGRCQSCGENIDDPHVHHITPRKEAGEKTDHWENLITLCSSCHKSLEKYSEARQRRLLRKHGRLNGEVSRPEDTTPWEIPQDDPDPRHRYESRAILTDAERRAINPDSEMGQNARSTHLSRVKKKMELLKADSQLLREHRPGLFEEAFDIFSDHDMNERVARLEDQVEELRDQLESE